MFKLGAVILAAGDSLRMGESKSGVVVDNELALIGLIKSVYEAGVVNVCVVLGKNYSNDCELLTACSVFNSLNLIIVNNLHTRRGSFYSLQLGLTKLLNKCTVNGVVAFLVDTFRANIGLYKWFEYVVSIGYNGLVPKYKNRGGHPVFMNLELINKINALSYTNEFSRLDKILKNPDNKLFFLDTTCIGVSWSWNTVVELDYINRLIVALHKEKKRFKLINIDSNIDLNKLSFNKNILVTGKVNSGKSLLCSDIYNKCIKNNLTVGGFIQKGVWGENGNKNYALHLLTKSAEYLVAYKNNEEGYAFNNEVFAIAYEQFILDSCVKDVVILDEYGWLETNGGGHSECLKIWFKNIVDGSIVLCVRENVLFTVIERFGLELE